MNPAEILAKLGLAEGAAPEAIVEALIKYLAGPDAPEAKSATVMGLLSMLAPAPVQPSSETPAEQPVENKVAPVEPGKDPEAMRAAMEALDSENRALSTRLAEMEASMKRAVEEKPVAPEKTPEERAAAICGDGQWPMDSRAALVEQLKQGKTPYLWAKGHFTSRSARFTAGGNPVKPNFGADEKAPTKVQSDVKGMFKLVERNVKTITGAARPTVQ